MHSLSCGLCRAWRAWPVLCMACPVVSPQAHEFPRSPKTAREPAGFWRGCTGTRMPQTRAHAQALVSGLKHDREHGCDRCTTAMNRQAATEKGDGAAHAPVRCRAIGPEEAVVRPHAVRRAGGPCMPAFGERALWPDLVLVFVAVVASCHVRD